MAKIDQIIEQLLGDRRISEGAAFSTRTFSDQPIIERGSDFKKRMSEREKQRAEHERRSAERKRERGERHQQQGEARQRSREAARTSTQKVPEQPARDPFARSQQVDPQPATRRSYASDFGEYLRTTFDQIVNSGTQQLKNSDLPKQLREMRKLEGRGIPSELAYGSNLSASLFYRQARLVEDYQDDFTFNGYFSQYYPTYASMTNQQLRGYFSWRTRVRAGNVTDAPLSFAFVYVYELLCGIGTVPGAQGLHDLRGFGTAYRQANEIEGACLMSYLRRWTHDYAIYHDIAEPDASAPQASLGSAVLTLLTAEHTQLRAAELEPRIANAAVTDEPPTTDQVFAALGEASSYHIGQSRLMKDEPELLALVATDVFAALVTHCAKRRKTDFVEGLFGYATNSPYTMYAGAVFFDPEPHPDCQVRVSPTESYACTNGRWRQQLACEATARNSDLGLVMHEVDFELRKQLDYAYPLKQRKVPKYVESMVQKAVATRLKERADAVEAQRKAAEEAERRRISIDLSKLSHIRAAAALTQEALLTDEERGLDMVAEPVPAWPLAGTTAESRDTDQLTVTAATKSQLKQPERPAATDSQAAAGLAAAEQPKPASPQVSQPATAPQPAPPAASAPQANACLAATEYGLTDLELRVLVGLMNETPASALLGPTDPFVSVVVDTINEKLFDAVGDAVIEFDGDDPRIIEDYREDVREVLNP